MNKFSRLLIALSAFFLMAAAPNAPLLPKIATQKIFLPNGLKVLVTEMPASPVVTIDIFVKAGSATEGEFLGTGVTHFLEHMLFKGTESRGVGIIPKEVQGLGGTINGSTSMDRTFFTVTVPNEAFHRGLEILADMMQHPRLDAVEIEKEKEVVISEMRLYRDRPERYLSDLVFKNAYIVHPYRVPIIGHEELLKRLTRDDFVRYYKTFYVPNNMVVSIAGNISSEQAFAAARELFSDFPRGYEVVRNLPPEPPVILPRRYEEEYKTEITRMSITFPGVAMRSPDIFALDALASILSHTAEVEIYKKQKLVHRITASNFTPIDQGAFEIEATLDAENIDKTIDAVQQQISLIQKNGVAATELQRVKGQILSDYVEGLQLSGDLAYDVGYSESAVGDPQFSIRYLKSIQDLNSQDIQRVSQKYLLPEVRSVVILKPQKSESATKIPKAKQAQDRGIEKYTLPNGLRILLREDRALPIVSINLALNGGVRFESEELNGLSFVNLSLWKQGTRRLTAEQLSLQLQARGINLYGFSNESYFGLHCNLLSPDTDFALDLLEELIMSPRFDPEEFKLIKESMKTAILSRGDSIGRVTMMRMRDLLFPGHPLSREVDGTMASVDRMTLTDIKNFYRRLVAPNNMVLSISGDISKEKVLEILQQKFSRLKVQPLPAPPFSMPELKSSQDVREKVDKKQAMVAVGFQGINFSDPDRYGLEVMAAVLGSPFRGRIFTVIRDQFGQSYNLGGSSYVYQDGGMLYFYALTSPENVLAVKETLLNILRELPRQGVSDEELRDLKTFLKGNFVTGIQTNSGIATKAMMDELRGLGYDEFQRYNANIDKVSKEDVVRLAKKYLDLSRAVIITVAP